jgi:folate-dependent phosphoribosylglycinamide formyltransferase PurN
MNKKWIALFSQTGSEIVNISNIIKVKPNIVLTNNTSKEQWHSEITTYNHIVSSHNALMHILRDNYIREECFITLHGYLRIIPDDVCVQHEIYNGHPAPINLYPDLKGKNKQEDQFIFKEKYNKIGSVIHKVTPELDDGEIIISINQVNRLQSIDDAYSTLKQISLETWIMFFSEYLQNRGVE